MNARILVVCCIVSNVAFAQKVLPYKNARLPVAERVDDLLKRMTPEEKFFQLFMIPGDLDNLEPGQFQHGIFGLQVSAGGKEGDAAQQMISYNTRGNALALARKINTIQKFFVEKTRLGIPIIPFDEALHGLVREGATAFPQSIALAATFDTTLMHNVAAAIANETATRGIRQVLSPVVNIASDVRWGRVEETYGEDPLLSAAMGLAYIRAFEENNVVTTPKHFVANVGDGGRDSYPIDLNERILAEIHFPPFITAIHAGGARSIMTSYNSVNGSPATANPWLLTQKLKKEWGFKGFVISDAGATGGSTVLHNTSAAYPEAAAQAINAGLDVIFQTQYNHYKLFIPPFLDGRISQQRIDDAVSRVLRVKFELGLFEHPYVDEKELDEQVRIKKQKELARKAAMEAVVLLKNENHTLPLREQLKTIAVIGEDAVAARLGGYSGTGNNVVSVLEGIRQRAAGQQVAYAPGCARVSQAWEVIAPAYLSNNKSKGLQAEYFNNISLSGTPKVMTAADKIDFMWTLGSPAPSIHKDFFSARWTGKLTAPRSGTFKIGLDGNDGYRLFINGRLLIDNWKKQTYSTTLVDFTFEKDRAYDLRVEFFEPVGNARIRLIWDATVEDNEEAGIAAAVDAASRADAVIVVAGIREGEFQDRASLALPGRQEELIRRVAAAGKPVVVVLIGGSAITMRNWIGDVGAVVDAWYPGEEGGNAVAQALFGDYNPAGRLPVTFPIDESQLPLVYNHKPTGRGDDYYNLSGLPQFPFGFGLSYSTFEYSDFRLEKEAINKEESAVIHFKIKNNGPVAGDEVVQLYIQDELASVARPVMELKGFQRIHLADQETREITFTIDPDMLMMLNDKLERVVEPGSFRIMIGASSRDIRLKGRLHVKQ